MLGTYEWFTSFQLSSACFAGGVQEKRNNEQTGTPKKSMKFIAGGRRLYQISAGSNFKVMLLPNFCIGSFMQATKHNNKYAIHITKNGFLVQYGTLS